MPKKKKELFHTKIPQNLHKPILEWYICGMNTEGIRNKLINDHNLKYNIHTVIRLLDYLKTQSQKIIEQVLAKETQNQVVTDFQGLNNLKSDLESLAKISFKNDNHMYLRTVDRLIKVFQIKFSLVQSTKSDSSIDEQKIKDQLLEKLGNM